MHIEKTLWGVPLKTNKYTFQILLEIFLVSFKLGLTSFGGPAAHLGYFHHEYVQKRKWMDERSYGDLVALCQFLPGPASSQVGMGVGLLRGGLLGAIISWIGFTLPSVLVLVFFASFLNQFDLGSAGWIHGLKLVAVAIVAHAIWGMAQKLTPDRNRATIAIVTAAIALLWPSSWTQVILIIICGFIGWFLYRNQPISQSQHIKVPISKKDSSFLSRLILWTLTTATNIKTFLLLHRFI